MHFLDKIINGSNTNEQELDKVLEKRFYGKCLHKFANIFKFEGVNRTTLKLSFVSISYIVIYLPWFVFQINFTLGQVPESYDLYKYIFHPISMLPFAGCAVNPLIYTFVDPKFRSQCKALFQ